MTGGLKSGELFAGTGNLGRAVDAEFGSTPAWFAEFDPAPSKVLAHHFPDVPNFGDVTKVDFRAAPHTHIRSGGFPCTDVSTAGRQAGLRDGTRSGLWSEFARSIDEDRPDWVVIENVRGLLSAGADSDVERCPWCLGDDPDQHPLRALGAVLGDLADLGFDAEWTGLPASDIGAPHGRFRIFILAWPQERTVANPGSGRNRGGPLHPDTARERGQTLRLTGQILAPTGDLLPTPVAQPSGNTPEDHLRKKPGRSRVTDLSIMAENDLIRTGGRLLPTPTAADKNASGGSAVNVTLTDAVVRTQLGTRPNPRHGAPDAPTPNPTNE